MTRIRASASSGLAWKKNLNASSWSSHPNNVAATIAAPATPALRSNLRRPSGRRLVVGCRSYPGMLGTSLSSIRADHPDEWIFGSPSYRVKGRVLSRWERHSTQHSWCLRGDSSDCDRYLPCLTSDSSHHHQLITASPTSAYLLAVNSRRSAMA